VSICVRTEAPTFRVLATILALALLLAIIVLPLVLVFVQALSAGLPAALAGFSDPDTSAAIILTLIVAPIAVLVNTIGGLAASWCIARFSFPGRGVLLTVVELPLSISPVIAGMTWVLLFGRGGWFAHWLDAAGLRIVFAVPGLVLATIFVTFPYVARQVLPLMQHQGSSEEEAATTLGAGFFTLLLHVTLPNIRWALLQGVLLCNARAMGEFGAVAVVSGHIRGATMTIPLQVEALYNDFQTQAAFALAALLAGLALITLVVRLALRGVERAAA
jgi:sulfate/thiosulfate transport system permease protein